MSTNYASKAIAIARAEVGYLEKASNSQLDSKTANTGSKNYTKYAAFFDKEHPNFYNTPKNGYPWCDVFFDWVLCQAFGVEVARKMIYQPLKSAGAGCEFSAHYYKINGKFYSAAPKPGDQIFFSDYAHTGIVVEVKDGRVYTIEGNTSSEPGVVANGGAVREKSYALSDASIDGYGRPAYDKEPEVEKEYKPSVLEWQVAAISDGFAFPKYGADGIWGSECETVASRAIVKKRFLSYQNRNLTKIVQKVVGVAQDGLCGSDTDKAIKAYQQKHGLEVDGHVGLNTWKKMLGV